LEGPDAAALLAALARTLAAAHAVGVVHGDVTPANVVLHPDRGPVLVDWGLAEVGDAGPPRPAALTPAYAAPERRRGMPPGPPGDVYGAAATVLAALGRPPDGAALVAPVPAEVADPPAAALRRALALDPRRRPSAAELAVLVAERPSAGAQPARPRRFRRPWSGWGRAAGRR
jgi:serine/threonine protein kinase